MTDAPNMEDLAKPDRSVPDLSNATISFLIDEIGRLRRDAARIKFLDGIYKQALEARCHPEQKKGSLQMIGERFIGDYEMVTQERLDGDAVREHYANDPEGLKKFIKVIKYKQLNIKPKPAPES